MIDRVTDAVGRLGPVGDADAMAANILDRLDSRTVHAMASRARADALHFSWDSSMERLFGHVYPAAFARRAPSRCCARRRRSCRLTVQRAFT